MMLWRMGEGGNGGYVLFLKKYGDSPNRVIRVSYVPIVRGKNLRERVGGRALGIARLIPPFSNISKFLYYGRTTSDVGNGED